LVFAIVRFTEFRCNNLITAYFPTSSFSVVFELLVAPSGLSIITPTEMQSRPFRFPPGRVMESARGLAYRKALARHLGRAGIPLPGEFSHANDGAHGVEHPSYAKLLDCDAFTVAVLGARLCDPQRIRVSWRQGLSKAFRESYLL